MVEKEESDREERRRGERIEEYTGRRKDRNALDATASHKNAKCEKKRKEKGEEENE